MGKNEGNSFVRVLQCLANRRLNLESVIAVVQDVIEIASGREVFACLEAPAGSPRNGAFSHRQTGAFFNDH